MGYLSEALKRYYKKEGNHILFQKNISLSTLALQMWENLGYQKVDASVVSRVLQGKRLFTPSQLQAFCSILSLSKGEEEFLFQCLSKDYFQRDNVMLDSHLVSENDLFDIFETVAHQATKSFYKGDSQQVIDQDPLIQSLYEKIAPEKLSKSQLKRLLEQYGYFLFLKERSVAGTATAQLGVHSIISTATMLTDLSKRYEVKNLYSYAHMLFADVYYMYGAYSRNQQAENFKKAITHSHRAFSLLEDVHMEKISALRLMIASACYIRDEETIRYVEKEAQALLPLQSSENITNVIHLSKTITKGKVLAGDSHSFGFEENVFARFGKKAYEETAAYFELSNIKTRLETLTLLGLSDKNILQPLIQRGLDLAEQKYPRHKAFFKKQAKLLA